MDTEESNTRIARPGQRSEARLYGALAGLMITTFLVALDVTIIATAIPSILSAFRTTGDIGWYGAAYSLTLCSLQPVIGKCASLFPLRTVYQLSLAMFLLGSLICATATSRIMFLAARGVAGAGAAGLSTGGLSIIAAMAPVDKRPLFTSLVLSLYAIGTVIAPVLGGVLTEKVSWRWCFYINLPCGAVSVVCSMLYPKVPQTTLLQSQPPVQVASIRRRLQELDVLGCLLFMGSVILTLMALQWGGHTYPWRSSTIIGLFVGSGFGFMIFLVFQIHKRDKAMLPYEVMSERTVTLGAASAFLLYAAFIPPIYYLPEWFQVIKGSTPLESGILMLPSVGCQVIGYHNPWFLLGTAIFCTAAGLFTTMSEHGTPISHYVSFEVLQGLGAGLAAQAPLLITQTFLAGRAEHIPMAMSLIVFSQYFGGAVSQGIAGALFENRLSHGLAGVGLTGAQINILLASGNAHVNRVIAESFPDYHTVLLKVYNDSLTSVFWVSVTAGILAVLAFLGVTWVKLENQGSSDDGVKD
ncbi:MFS general substrate transporter [Aspergillus transmontanensis]|uniref:MFS general substrate transporter n=1 Tax=Aspergillus transmontanensis TaxID=1034304 RepID=A0A5N6VRP6_9EURO|nr:MFS general substrate transporter [Aspergillus transmontanensis]